MKAGKTLTAKILDKDGNVQQFAEDTLTKDVVITVNTGFFARLKAFFFGLFGCLPSVELKP
ncbi:MAG: hypothetical protein IJT44_01755 [Clostridia bacterium]|nr:hypothetical protein [Clostridia bacterium]